MNDLERQEGEIAALRIEGEMTIYRAAELKQMLLAALDSARALEVDLSAVTEFDSAGVQLLLLARKSAEKLGREFRLKAQSSAVAEVFQLLGLGSHFAAMPASDLEAQAAR